MTHVTSVLGRFRFSSFHAIGMAALLGTVACGGPAPDDASVDQSTLNVTAAPYTKLGSGTRATLVDGIASAENLLFTSDGRLLATGNDGIHEIRRDGTNAATAPILFSSPSGCSFGGMVEVAGVVYANCYDFKASVVFAASLSSLTAFRSVVTLDGILLANGLSADASGRLYVGETFNNQIARLTLSPSDPFTVAKQETWFPGSGLFTDGMKVFRSFAYWTDFATVQRAAIRADGSAGPIWTLLNAVTFLDDLYVDADGILAADYLGNSIRAYGLLGQPIGQTPAVFTNPSSVLPAKGRLGLGANDLVVTEKGANRVAVYTPDH